MAGKSFDDALRAAFEAGRRSNDASRPWVPLSQAFEEWRADLAGKEQGALAPAEQEAAAQMSGPAPRRDADPGPRWADGYGFFGDHRRG